MLVTRFTTKNENNKLVIYIYVHTILISYLFYMILAIYNVNLIYFIVFIVDWTVYNLHT